MKKSIGHAFEPLHLPVALALGGGVALFLVGDVLFRRALRIGRSGYRLGAAGLAVLTVALGPVLAAAQLVGLFLVLIGLRVAEARAATSRPGVVPAR